MFSLLSSRHMQYDLIEATWKSCIITIFHPPLHVGVYPTMLKYSMIILLGRAYKQATQLSLLFLDE